MVQRRYSIGKEYGDQIKWIRTGFKEENGVELGTPMMGTQQGTTTPSFIATLHPHSGGKSGRLPAAGWQGICMGKGEGLTAASPCIWIYNSIIVICTVHCYLLDTPSHFGIELWPS